MFSWQPPGFEEFVAASMMGEDFDDDDLDDDDLEDMGMVVFSSPIWSQSLPILNKFGVRFGQRPNSAQRLVWVACHEVVAAAAAAGAGVAKARAAKAPRGMRNPQRLRSVITMKVRFIEGFRGKYGYVAKIDLILWMSSFRCSARFRYQHHQKGLSYPVRRASSRCAPRSKKCRFLVFADLIDVRTVLSFVPRQRRGPRGVQRTQGSLRHSRRRTETCTLRSKWT